MSSCSICSTKIEQAETKLGVTGILVHFYCFVFHFYSSEAPPMLWILFTCKSVQPISGFGDMMRHADHTQF